MRASQLSGWICRKTALADCANTRGQWQAFAAQPKAMQESQKFIAKATIILRMSRLLESLTRLRASLERWVRSDKD